MTNYYNSLNNEEKKSQLGKCRFMKSEEFSDGVNILIEKKNSYYRMRSSRFKSGSKYERFWIRYFLCIKTIIYK